MTIRKNLLEGNLHRQEIQAQDLGLRVYGWTTSWSKVQGSLSIWFLIVLIRIAGGQGGWVFNKIRRLHISINSTEIHD